MSLIKSKLFTINEEILLNNLKFFGKLVYRYFNSSHED